MAHLKIATSDYDELDRFLGHDTSRRIGNNTYLVGSRLRGIIGVQLHRTVVVRIDRQGNVKLNTGGWVTPTTMDRINQFLPRGVGIGICKGEAELRRFSDGNVYCEPYWDGMVLDRFGNLAETELEGEVA